MFVAGCANRAVGTLFHLFLEVQKARAPGQIVVVDQFEQALQRRFVSRRANQLAVDSQDMTIASLSERGRRDIHSRQIPARDGGVTVRCVRYGRRIRRRIRNMPELRPSAGFHRQHDERVRIQIRGGSVRVKEMTDFTGPDYSAAGSSQITGSGGASRRPFRIGVRSFAQYVARVRRDIVVAAQP